jgi:hypothetical protein
VALLKISLVCYLIAAHAPRSIVAIEPLTATPPTRLVGHRLYGGVRGVEDGVALGVQIFRLRHLRRPPLTAEVRAGLVGRVPGQAVGMVTATTVNEADPNAVLALHDDRIEFGQMFQNLKTGLSRPYMVQFAGQP